MRKHKMSLPLLLLGVLIYTLGMGVSKPAYAGSYKLTRCGDVNGKNVDRALCDAYRKNFETRNDAVPMACERQYDPAIAGFSAPNWQRLDLEKYMELFTNVTRYLDRDANESKQFLAKRVKLRAENGHTALYVARLDLDGDGKMANVLAVREESDCTPTDKPGTSLTRLYVLNDALSDIDYPRQRSWFDVFNNSTIELFNGKPYIEHYEADSGWGQLLTGTGCLTVFREEHKLTWDKSRLWQVLQIQYTPSPDAFVAVPGECPVNY